MPLETSDAGVPATGICTSTRTARYTRARSAERRILRGSWTATSIRPWRRSSRPGATFRSGSDLMSDRVRPYLFYDAVISICTQCYRKIDGKILFEDGKVLLVKRCPE